MNRLLMTSGLLVLSFCASLTGQQPTGPKPQETREPLRGFLTEGGITNVVDGHAMYLRFERGPQLLNAQQKLENNDEVWVGDQSRAEILLNPGAYLRLSPNSRVRFLDLSPDNLKLKLLQGSAIIEVLVDQFERNPSGKEVRDKFTAYQPITVITPDAEFVTARSGIYRGDVNSEGQSSLKVVKGVAVVAGDLIKEGKSTRLGDRIPTANNFDIKQEDDFDSWSRKRALELVALNKSLRKTDWHTKLRKNPQSFFSIVYDEYSKRIKERLVVSAIGGLVSYAEPGAVIQRDQGEWQPLVSDAALEYGDRIKTDRDARVEVRVYPHCYLLMAGNTEIIYGSNKEGLAAIRVLKGSAIIASGIPEKEDASVTFLAGDSVVELLKPGFYRLNVNPSRESDFLVYDGEVKLDGTELKTGQRAILFGPRLIVAHTRRMDLDAFELWSRKRSSLLFQPTDLLRKQRISPSIATRRVELTGLWYFDETSGAHTFVPGFREFSSPYGGRYAVGFAGKFHR